MFCGLGEKERTRFRKKKKGKERKKKEKNGKIRKKKEKNLIAAKSGLVGMKGYHKTYNRVKMFFAVLHPVLNETAVYVKLEGRFSGSKTKVT